MLDQASLDRLHRAKGASKESSTILVQQLGLLGEDELLKFLSTITKLSTTKQLGLKLSAETCLPGFNKRFLKSARMFPLELADGRAAVAMADPFNIAAAEAIAYKLEKPVVRLIASLSEVDAALQDFAPDANTAKAPNAQVSAADLEALQDLASGAPVIKTVSGIIEKACALGASDIHFEPTETDLRVRMRINGDLQDMEPINYSLKLAAISRLKILARMDIAETRLPQDGRAKAAVRGKDIDLRVSSAPTLHGESIVIRILDRSAMKLDLAALGFSENNRLALEGALSAPNGLVFVSGPTGSGKTTTLYAALLKLNQSTRKIFTVEDPVEYRLAGVNQVQVNPKIGLTFASALRSLLRQDPDIMMVGEIRDGETAQIAVQAALTGHLVLATIHTNSAAATVTRLIDMGVEDYLIASCAGGFAAQRLVGTLCRKCAGSAPAPAKIFERFDVSLNERTTVGRAVGCPDCRGTGYSGRTTVSEIIRVTRDIEEAIARRATAAEIEQIAIAQGARMMIQDGLDKALSGVTSIEEVLRAVRT
ncbi:MAG: hypothetical protein A3E78_16650 [Alphaproteobacteria bacterium RIFCSPHIGHO2_12_FULL_63_12]|nr:MAG: hypothetical protein A3E78_16650 [Alphaproteobacteria bacterium RIFCSPHIGHO2_12_FULL_63_12]